LEIRNPFCFGDADCDMNEEYLASSLSFQMGLYTLMEDSLRYPETSDWFGTVKGREYSVAKHTDSDREKSVTLKKPERFTLCNLWFEIDPFPP
jgi:hypothetical protein